MTSILNSRTVLQNLIK